MKHYLFYGHGGAYNHGSEASLICGIKLLRELEPNCKITVSSHFPEQDVEFNLPADEIVGRDLNGTTNEEIYKPTIDKITPETVCISAGGDNYCYNNWERYALIHKKAIEKGAKSILWSCSLEPSMIDEKMLEVLKTHHLITARESFTENALLEKGLKNVVRVADIAFLLEPKETLIPKGKYIAINLSPLVLRKNPDALIAYQDLVDYILNETCYNIALVPHVVMPMDNDIEALSMLKGDEKRIFRASEKLNAREYKYIISKAEILIASRTHATIGAWSTGVPTIAVGYSNKAVGISSDLGQEKYLLDINTLTGQKLCEVFKEIEQNKENIKKELLEKSVVCKKMTVSEKVLAIFK
ncbi:MAG: polysaccharide pyruvyl transferase family protein [Ruminococcaceae bacterium]|nr:polysaccharide pyruvyl transferase family protein [Oscillospiraceae bacterium]